MNDEEKMKNKENIDKTKEIKDEIEKEKNETKIDRKNINIDELWNNISIYKLNYTNILNIIRRDKDINNSNEFLCNLLLMPEKIELSNKVSTLNLLSGIYKRRNQRHLIYQIINKFDKKLESLMSIEPAIVANVFVRGMEFLKKQGNYIYSYKYLIKTNEILEKNAIIIKKKYNMENFENFCQEINAEYIKNVIIYRTKFADDESIKDDDLEQIKKLIDLLMDDKYEIESEDENEYLYAINKKWIVKAKSFIENYIKAKKDNLQNFYEEAFEPQFIYESYFDIKSKKKDKDKDKPKLFFAFPGPINNFEISKFKDYWKDSKNLDENYFMKKGVKLKEDYLLINEKDWKLLSDTFGATNEIKRKKSKIDLIQLKFILFDKRISYDNENSHLLKEKYILINQNINMKELKDKIIRVTNGAFNIEEDNEIIKTDENEEEKKGKEEEQKKENKEEEVKGENKEKEPKKENKDEEVKDENKKNNEEIEKSENNDNIQTKDKKEESTINENTKNSEDTKSVENIKVNTNIKEEKVGEGEKEEENLNKEKEKSEKEKSFEKGKESEKSHNEVKKEIDNKANKKFQNTKDLYLSFFILDKNKKDLLIEITLSLLQCLPSYESLFINEISPEEIEETKPLTNLLKLYNKEKHILLIDLYSSKEEKFLFDLKMKNEFKCSICSKPIEDLKQRYKCEICNYSLFCSKECSDKSNPHKRLNKRLFSYKDKIFVLSELLSMNLDDLLSKNSNHGRVGLGNMGNTCYMNSALQCLSNTEDLTKYFLFLSFKTEINNASSLSSKGSISKAYYNLIDSLWNEPNDGILPKNFRITFCKKTGLFLNNEQQDSQEFLICLLDNLHEDLNRITNKKYQELEEQRNNETDEEASQRWWNYYKSRENSIIVDLFQGQYKSTIKCLKCGKTSTSYDTYMSLGLPIPTQKTQIQIKLLTEDLKFIDLNIKMNDKVQIKDIIKKAILFIDKEKYKKLLNKNNENDKDYEVPMDILYNNIEIIEFNDNFKMVNKYETAYENINKCIIKKKDHTEVLLFDNLKLIDLYKNNNNTELILFEKNINLDKDDYIINIYIYPITTKKIEGIFSSSNKDILLSYPIIVSIEMEKSLEDLETLVFKKLEKFLKLNKKESIELCYPHLNKEWGKFKSTENICPLCQKKIDSSKKYCQLTNKKILISQLFNKQSKRPLIFFAKSQSYFGNKEFYKGIPLFNEKSTAEIKSSRNNLSVYDAFDLFNKEEYLEGDNQWYCNNCKQHQNAAKKIEIYKTPLYLIIQLKRFKQRNSFVRFIMGSKNTTYINYKEVLNVNNFVVGPDKDKSIYDLYAITIHKEFMNGGHYIAFCKNKGIWVTYDDEKVSRCENPISKDAYLLFYKKKSIE